MGLRISQRGQLYDFFSQITIQTKLVDHVRAYYMYTGIDFHRVYGTATRHNDAFVHACKHTRYSTCKLTTSRTSAILASLSAGTFSNNGTLKHRMTSISTSSNNANHFHARDHLKKLLGSATAAKSQKRNAKTITLQ